MIRLKADHWLIWIVFVLTACGINPHKVDDGLDKNQQAWLLQQAQWVLKGRISITTDEEQWHASIRWLQSNDHYQIALVGPLGQGTLQLVGDSNTIQLTTAQGERYVAQTPEALLQKHLNLSLPVSGLRYWILGLAQPHLEIQDASIMDGNFIKLQQNGWDINYRRYKTLDNVKVPSKIFMSRERLDIRVIIHDWQFEL